MSVHVKKCERKCCVPDCKSRITENTIFHKFPNDANRKEEWIRACNITTKVTSDMQICGYHFAKDDYESDATSGIRQLKPSAVPKQNLGAYILAQSKRQNSTNVNYKRCSVPHCVIEPGEKRSFHLPPKQEDYRQKWVRACGAAIVAHPYAYVCSGHFERSDFITGPNSKKQVLKMDAVPSLNLPKSGPMKQLSKVEDITTIIYMPENSNKSNISGSGLEYSKTVKQENVNLNTKNVFSQVQNSQTIQSINDIKPKAKTSPVKNVTMVKESVNSAQLQKSSQNKMTVPKKAITTEQNSVNRLVKQGISSNNVANQKSNVQAKNIQTGSAKKTVVRSGVSAVTLCADCGQYCKIEDEDLLYKSYKNSETLAAELLLELQEVTLSNEDEHILLTKKGIEICNKAIQKQSINLMELLTSDNELMAFTGINFELLDKLAKLVSDVEGISSAKYTTPARNRIVICLCKLRINLSFACLGMLFGVTQQMCANNFFSMLKLLAVLLEKTIHWPNTEELMKDLPECFQSFKQTRVILNCSETQIEKQRCSNCQQKLLDSKLTNQTMKLILGVAPSGLIIFKNTILDSESADVSVFTQTNIMEKLDPLREAIMADRSLDIETECAERNITLIKLPKLGKNKQFSKNDVELIKNISSARIHVDRTLHRFKMYKIMQTKVHWRILPYLDDVCTVISGVVNLKNPIPPNDIDIKSVGPIRK